MRPAQQEEEAGLAQGKLRRQLRTGRALLALGLSGLRRQQSGTGYCEMLNDRLQFSWCSMCPRLGTARSGADARRLSSPRTLRCVAGSVSPQCGCGEAVASNSSTLEHSVLICSTEHSAGNCGPTLFVQRLRVHGLPSLCLRTSSSCGYMSRILRQTMFVVRAALFPVVGSVTRLVSSTRIARDSRFLTLLSATLQ